MCILSSLEKNSWNCCALLPSPDGTGYFPFVYRRFSFKSRVNLFDCVLVFVPLQPNQQPDQRPSITPSRVGHSPAANCATEPSTTDTLGPRTHTVHIRRTRLTRTPSSPTGSGTGAFMSTRSWAPCREVARPPRRRPLRDPGTLRNCSPTHPSPPRAARGARAAPRATAPRFPQRRRMVRHRLFNRIPYYKYLIGKPPRRESHCGASASPPDCCVHCILACLFCEFLTLCNIVLDCATCGSCAGDDSCFCCCCASEECGDCDLPCDMDCGILDACCESADCLEICMECCSLCFSSWGPLATARRRGLGGG